MADVRARLVRCFSAVFPDLSEAEIPRASTASVGTWDSLANFSLITVIEEEFGVQIGPDDVDGLVSFDLIADFLESRAHVS